MNIKKILTDEFKTKIKKTVQEAEKQSGGEIVTYITQKSDDYNYIYWAAGFLSAFLIIIIFIFLYNFYHFITSNILYFSGIIFLLPLLIIGLLYSIKSLRLLLIDKDRLDYYVNLKAKEAFLEQEIFKTEDRTGVLIYISIFEKRVVVLGDSGINKKVKKEKWDTVIKTIINGIKNNSLESGITNGILLCGKILKENNVKRKVRDKNELNDNIHVGSGK